MDRAISVIVPALNEAEHIGRTLEALQPMRERGCEIIVVDGGSYDQTVTIAEPLADIVLISKPGRAEQMAAGAGCASHQVLWFLHADTLVPADSDMLILQSTQERGWGRFNVILSGSHPLFRIIEKMINMRSCASGIATGDQGIFVRRALFELIGGMPQQPLMEDVELSRLLKRYGRPSCITTPLQTSSRRWEQRGIVRTVLLMWWLRAAYAIGVPASRLVEWYR